jgi:hypothetical protein
MKKLILVSLLILSYISLLTPAYATINDANTKVVSNDRHQYAYFGESVAIFGDYAIVGVPDQNFVSGEISNWVFSAGSAYLYKRNQAVNTWDLVEEISPKVGDASFGKSVAIDGENIVIGAWEQDTNGDDSGSNHGAVYIYENYTQGIDTPIVIPSDKKNTWFGKSVAISNDKIIVGAPWGHSDVGTEVGNYGAAYVYSKVYGSWTLEQQIVSAEVDIWFGQSVSISGDDLVIGSQKNSGNEGAGYTYHYYSGNWEENGSFPLPGREGVNLANKVLISKSFLFVTAYLDMRASFKIGSVSVYRKDPNSGLWVFFEKILAPDIVSSNAYFGCDISISDDEETLAIGAKGAKKVFFYSQTSTGWKNTYSVESFGNGSGFSFGQSVATTNTALVVGDPNHSYDINGQDSLRSAGAAYFFNSIYLPSTIEEYLTLTDSASKTLTSGLVTHVYGCSGINNIIIQSGAGAKLFNMPGKNTITIEADSSIFTVSRSGAYVTFEGTDKTTLKIPATLETQTIIFNDGSWSLIIDSGKVMLGNQEISLTPSTIN